MNSRFRSEMGDKQRQTRAVRDPTACRAVALFCAALAVVALCAPLLVTLPRTLDAVASPINVVGQGSTTAAPLSEQSPDNSYEQWVDTLEEGEIAQWRMRASD